MPFFWTRQLVTFFSNSLAGRGTRMSRYRRHLPSITTACFTSYIRVHYDIQLHVRRVSRLLTLSACPDVFQTDDPARSLAQTKAPFYRPLKSDESFPSVLIFVSRSPYRRCLPTLRDCLPQDIVAYPFPLGGSSRPGETESLTLPSLPSSKGILNTPSPFFLLLIVPPKFICS